METTKTSTTYPSRRAATWPATGPDVCGSASAEMRASAGGDISRFRRQMCGVVHVMFGTQGTSVPAFGPSVASLKLMNKSIVSAPQTDAGNGDVRGVPGIRSWSPPV